MVEQEAFNLKVAGSIPVRPIMLIHYSKSRLSLLEPVIQSHAPHHKPLGLWVSVDEAWKEWCESEEFHLEGLKYETEIVLNEDAKILYLTDAQDVDSFTDKYGANLTSEIYWINWDKVAREGYQGIIINPYLGSRRYKLKTSWYYGWDCASGCIWDIAAIKEFKERTC